MFCVQIAPVFRQIVCAADKTLGGWIFGGGQSGQLTSAHYDDLIQMFRIGQLRPFHWNNDDELKPETSTVILLQPKAD